MSPAEGSETTRFVARVGVAAVLLLLPLRVLSFGFAPEDDVLRETAKAVSGREWGDIALLRSDLDPALSEHAGWDWCLAFLHSVLHVQLDGLVVFAVCAFFLLAACTPLLFARRPEGVLVGLAGLALLDPAAFERWFYGRPYMLDVAWSMLVLGMVVRMSWAGGRAASCVLLGATALRVWIRSVLPLLGVPLLACIPAALLPRRGRDGLRLLLIVVVGALLGALFTGRPLAFILYNVRHFLLTLFGAGGSDVLVSELRPLPFNPGIAVLLVGLTLLEHRRGGWRAVLGSPGLLLACGGFLLGFRTARFWSEFGVAGLLFHGSMVVDRLPVRVPGALLALVAGAALWWFGVEGKATAWQRNPVTAAAGVPALYEEDRSWFPSTGGLLYSPSMRVFPTFFHLMPHAPWRYVTAMEPGFMPERHRRIYEQGQRTGDVRCIEPWIDEMTFRDRMVLVLPVDAPVRQVFPQLEWRFAEPRYWFGRKPPRAPPVAAPAVQTMSGQGGKEVPHG